MKATIAAGLLLAFGAVSAQAAMVAKTIDYDVAGKKMQSVLVYDDAAYGAEVHHFGPMGHATDTVRFPDADLAAVAAGHGVQSVTVRDVADLAPVGDWVRGGRGPMLVDAKVDPAICADWLQEAFRAG